MHDSLERKRISKERELRMECIAVLNKMGFTRMPDGQPFEGATLWALQFALLANGAVPGKEY